MLTFLHNDKSLEVQAVIESVCPYIKVDAMHAALSQY